MMQQAVKALSDEFGFAVAIAVIRRWGGRDWQVPMRVDAEHPLALTLGLETALRLAAAFGGQRLQLPDERRALLEARNAAIWRECMERGRSQESVGVEFGLTRQGVKMVLRKMQERHQTQAVAGADTAPQPAKSAPIRNHWSIGP